MRGYGGISRLPRQIELLFDEDFSWRLAKALQILLYPVRHVSLERGLGIWDEGAERGRKAEDADIASFCARQGLVLVTCDQDFRARGAREAILATKDVEVIWVNPQPQGLYEQHEIVARRIREWQATLGALEPAHRIWQQRGKGSLKRLKG